MERTALQILVLIAECVGNSQLLTVIYSFIFGFDKSKEMPLKQERGKSHFLRLPLKSSQGTKGREPSTVSARNSKHGRQKTYTEFGMVDDLPMTARASLPNKLDTFGKALALPLNKQASLKQAN